MSDKLIIDVIVVTSMSIQYFTRLVGIGSKSDDLHETSRTRRRRSSAVTLVTFSKTFLVSGRFSISECGTEGKEEQMTEIFFDKKCAECSL